MKKIDVFEAMNKIEAELKPLIMLDSVRLEFWRYNKTKDIISLVVYYQFEKVASNFTITNDEVKGLEILISKAKAEIAAITRKQPVSFTLAT